MPQHGPLCRQIFGDAYFIAPLYGFLEGYARAGGEAYAYSFTERGPDIYGNVVTFQGESSSDRRRQGRAQSLARRRVCLVICAWPVCVALCNHWLGGQ